MRSRDTQRSILSGEGEFFRKVVLGNQDRFRGFSERSLSSSELEHSCQTWANGSTPCSITSFLGRIVRVSLEQMIFDAAAVGGKLVGFMLESDDGHTAATFNIADAVIDRYFELKSKLYSAKDAATTLIAAVRLPPLYSPEAFDVVKKRIFKECRCHPYISITIGYNDGHFVSKGAELNQILLDLWKLGKLADAFSLDSVRDLVEDFRSYSLCAMGVMMHNLCWISYTESNDAVNSYADACAVFRRYSDPLLNDFVHLAMTRKEVLRFAEFYNKLEPAKVLQEGHHLDAPDARDLDKINLSLLNMAYKCRIILYDMDSWHSAMDSAVYAASFGSPSYVAEILGELNGIISTKNPLDLFPAEFRNALEDANVHKKDLRCLRHEALLDYYCDM